MHRICTFVLKLYTQTPIDDDDHILPWVSMMVSPKQYSAYGNMIVNFVTERQE